MNLSSFIVTFFLFALQQQEVNGSFVVTQKEKQCLESTGELFKDNNELIAARHNYATSMDTEMTSQLTMTAKYPDDKLKEYEKLCYANNGILHVIKIDFFDCKLGNVQKDVELTLKNFANCLADTEECAEFNQENLLEEAWEDLGLHCEVEDAPTNPATPRDNDDKPDHADPKDLPYNVDDDLAREEEKAAAGGADEMDKKEKAAEYTPKEEAGKKQKKKRSAGRKFFRFVTFVGIVGAIGYVVYDRRYGRFGGGRYPRLPFGGVATGSRFQTGMGGGGDSGFVSNYNLLSAEEELNFGAGDHELQLSSNLVS